MGTLKSCIIVICMFAYVTVTNSFGMNNRGSYLKLDKFESCDGTLNTPAIYNPAQIFLNENYTILNYNVTVKRDIKNELESVWIIEKCASKESLDSCQQFYKMRSPKYCNFLQVKGELWSSFIDCTKPKWECPMKKGTYVGKNCRLDLSLFKLFPLQNSYWRCKIIVNDVRAKTMVACAEMAGGLAKL